MKADLSSIWLLGGVNAPVRVRLCVEGWGVITSSQESGPMTTFKLRRRHVVPVAVAFFGAAAVVAWPAGSPSAGTASTVGAVSTLSTVSTKNYISNVTGYWPQVRALGFDVLDTSSSKSVVNSLPAGAQSMVWLGSGQKCPTPPDSTFRAAVDNLAGNPKVYGYYIADEPEILSCASGPTNLKARVDYIRAKHPAAKTFIVIDDQVAMVPYAPARTRVNLVGLDPYPCNTRVRTCDLTKIAQRVGWATTAGIPRSAIVPVIQAFGQEDFGGYYRMPTRDEFRALLAEWARLVPTPQMDYTYSWKNQPRTSDPTLIDAPLLQQLMKAHNG